MNYVLHGFSGEDIVIKNNISLKPGILRIRKHFNKLKFV